MPKQLYRLYVSAPHWSKVKEMGPYHTRAEAEEARMGILSMYKILPTDFCPRMDILEEEWISD